MPRGRPKAPAGTSTITIRLPDWVLAEVDTVARSVTVARVTRNQVLLTAIRRGLGEMRDAIERASGDAP